MVPHAGHSLFGDFIFLPLPSTNQSQAATHDRSLFGSVQLILPSFRDFPQRNYTITKNSIDLTTSHQRETVSTTATIRLSSTRPRNSRHRSLRVQFRQSVQSSRRALQTIVAAAVEPVSLSEEIRRSKPAAVSNDTSNPRPC